MFLEHHNPPFLSQALAIESVGFKTIASADRSASRHHGSILPKKTNRMMPQLETRQEQITRRSPRRMGRTGQAWGTMDWIDTFLLPVLPLLWDSIWGMLGWGWRWRGGRTAEWNNSPKNDYEFCRLHHILHLTQYSTPSAKETLTWSSNITCFLVTSRKGDFRAQLISVTEK